MRVLQFDKKHGILVLTLENDDDLWHLSNIITEGTLVKSKTARKLKKEFGEERTETEKVNLTLVINVEKVAYHEYSNILRVSGTIVEGPPSVTLGSHHTLSIVPGSKITIRKQEWSPLDLERVRKARVQEPKALIVLIDRDQTVFVRLSAAGPNIFAENRSSIPPKAEARQYEAALDEFVSQAASLIVTETARDTGAGALPVIIAGPGNVKDKLAELLTKKSPDIEFTVCNASNATSSAISEILSSQTLKIVEKSSARRETLAVEEVLKRISKNEPVAYGMDEVQRAVELRAVEQVLITDVIIRAKRRDGTFNALESLLKDAESNNGAKIVIIGSKHQAGRQLDGLGGIAALLRFRV